AGPGRRRTLAGRRRPGDGGLHRLRGAGGGGGCVSTSPTTTAAPPGPRPAVAEPAPWSFPEPERFVLTNGLAVQAFHMPGQRVLSRQLGVPAPLAGEPPEAEGVGLIMARCLDLGTARHTADE